MKHSITKLELKGDTFLSKKISIEKSLVIKDLGCTISQEENGNMVEISLTKKELSEFIGLMLHVQSSIKREMKQL
tara:strand:- start:2060 stop:2284 length:225 start_codon:yes stop_codon:yes gene_type:complete